MHSTRRFAARALGGFALTLLASASVNAQVPFAGIPTTVFESWAPLGEYERVAFAEEGSLRIVIPTKERNVEIAFTPRPVQGEDYGAEQIDRAGLRTGGAPPAFTAYTGRVEANSGRDFAKLGVSSGRGRLEGLLRVDGSFYALEANLAADDYVIAVREVAEAEVEALAKSCGVTADELQLPTSAPGTSGAGASSVPSLAASGALREIELGTEADALFVSQTGGSAAANARILSIVNMVNGIYETDLGLTNRVVAQRTHTGADPYTTTDASGLLNQFRSQFLANVASVYDDAMLFSGRNFDGSTVGVAFVAETCTPYRFGIAQFLSQSDFNTSLIAAHELGHNLGANHTSSGIMAPSITGETYFSQASKDEIGLYTGSVACLALAAGSGTNQAPTLDPVGPQIVTEGQALSIQLSATDPDGDAITYGATPLPQGASLTLGGLFSFTPVRAAAGCGGSTLTTVQFTASDGTLSANESVPISIADANTNAAPVLTDPADRDVYVGQLVQFQLQASDIDGDTIAFSSSNLPAGATLSAGGSFSWTPSSAQVADVTVRASDCTGLTSSQSLQISATSQPPPHLISLSKTTGWNGDVITLSGTALSGRQVSVIFRNRAAAISALSDTSITLTVPRVKKKYRKRGAQPVRLIRDGVSADNVLSFDYVWR